jgi:hypothetical protein
MKAKFVPANLTVETFIQRTMAGEVFYKKNDMTVSIYYDDQSGGTNPFKVSVGNSKSQDFNNWNGVSSFNTKQEITWKDEVSEENPIPCWVSDTGSEKRSFISPICNIKPEQSCQYIAKVGTIWKYATPVLPSECRQD